MADVVVRGTDQLTEDGAVLAEGRHVATGDLDRLEAGRHATGTVGTGGLGRGVEVELVGAVDQAQLGGDVVVVDLVDPVDQGHLLGEDVLGAEVAGVGRVGGQRQAVEVALDGLAGCGRAVLRGRVDGLADGRDLALGLPRCRRGQCVGAIAEDGGRAGAVVGRVDVPVAAATGRTHEGVEAHLGEVERDRCAGVVDAATGPGADLGVLGGEPGLHALRLLDSERLQGAVGARDLDDGRAVATGETRAQGGEVDAGGGVLLGLDADLRAAGREPAERGEGRVAVGRGGGRRCGEARQHPQPQDGCSEYGETTCT